MPDPGFTPLHSNFIPDIRKINLVPREKRGKGTRNM